MAKVVPIKAKDPECAYFVVYQVGDGDPQLITDGLEAIHLLWIRKHLSQLEDYLVGDDTVLVEE